MKKLALLTAFALGACSTDPYSFTYHDLTDPSRVLNQTHGDVTITVRAEPAAFVGAGCLKYFTLDGEKLVQLQDGEQYTFKIPQGQHTVGGRFECLVPSYVDEVSLNAHQGANYIYRIYPSVSDGCHIAPMSR